ncbi:MAG: 3-keto-5-aminohexanoate cleavage protein, partial [Clostridiales Family XIII bacterium]|jgi:3-keto-5-aminohexanoate cleavage enzyme|nr:3-keto-5-aminohexanoate cleavage protein [Clostridiales Family XIII bacterium]
MAKKIIITVAPTSNFHGKEKNPALPEQPDEIAQSVYECYNAGAAIAHIHCRDRAGVPTNDIEVVREACEKIKAKSPKIIVQPSTAPANRSDRATYVDDGLSALEAGTEMCSLDMGISVTPSLCPEIEGPYHFNKWTRGWLQATAKKITEKGIKPEMEIFNHSGLEDAINLLLKPGLIAEPASFTFVMNMHQGNQGCIEYSMENLTHLVRKLPPNANFGVIGIGATQLPATIAALLLGGNVRVGMEDNIYFSRGELAKSNAQLVERIAARVRELGHEVATPDEAREILNIKKK